MAKETAIAPEFSIGEINEEASGEVKAPKEDTTGREIASLKMNKGWQEIEEYINGRLNELSDFDIGQLGVEEIGYRYALISALRKELQVIIDIVDSNYEFEKGRKKEGTK